MLNKLNLLLGTKWPMVLGVKPGTANPDQNTEVKPNENGNPKPGTVTLIKTTNLDKVLLVLQELLLLILNGSTGTPGQTTPSGQDNQEKPDTNNNGQAKPTTPEQNGQLGAGVKPTANPDQNTEVTTPNETVILNLVLIKT